MLKDIIKTYRDNPGFRPLIRGFFFYKGWLDTYAKEDTVPVSVPSFGDSFFIIWKMALKLSHWASFRPLIRGFFFYIDFRRCSYVQW